MGALISKPSNSRSTHSKLPSGALRSASPRARHAASPQHGMPSSPAGKRVRFDAEFLHVDLTDGRVISTPMRWYPELRKASLGDSANYKFICDGTGIEWPKLDYHLSVESMLVIASPLKKAI